MNSSERETQENTLDKAEELISTMNSKITHNAAKKHSSLEHPTIQYHSGANLPKTNHEI